MKKYDRRSDYPERPSKLEALPEESLHGHGPGRSENGNAVIGLFQGMFERNIMTFNPGWDSNAQKLAKFTDVRDLQRQLKAQGVQFQVQADESTAGPASLIAVDPDGNPILVDQHV